MSAGTMISLAANAIVMGKQSNLGPIDPQYGGMSCTAVLEEFEIALADVKENPSSVNIWSNIIRKYHPTFVGDCKKAIDWSEQIVKQWLEENMFRESKNPTKDASKVVEYLSSHNNTYSHARHIHIDDLKKIGVKVIELENLDNTMIGKCKDLQDCVLTIHQAYMNVFAQTSAIKIVENHAGSAMITSQVS